MSKIKQGELTAAITYVFALAFFLFLISGLAGCGSEHLAPLCETPEIAASSQYIVHGTPSEDLRSTVAVRATGGYCSGTVVGPHTILTAAHCENLNIVCLGGINEACIPIDEDIVHPTANMPGARDLRILYVAPDLEEWGIPVAPLDDGSEGEACTLLAQGYGYGSDGALHEREVTQDGRIHGILYGSESVCNGDSGGPLYRIRPDGSYTLVGVTSFGINEPYNCEGGTNGFVDLTQDGNLEWVKELIK